MIWNTAKGKEKWAQSTKVQMTKYTNEGTVCRLGFDDSPQATISKGGGNLSSRNTFIPPACEHVSQALSR